MDSKILLIFLILSGTALALLWLASQVWRGDTFALDRVILRALRTGANLAIPVGPSWLIDPMIDVTALGSVTVLTLITILVVGYLVAIHRRSTAIFMALAISGGAMLSSALKAFFFRPRPEIVPHLVHVSSASFPSGHAMNSAVVYLTLASLMARVEQGKWVRTYLLSVAITLTLLIGISRVYLGVHWPSDVIEGWGVGAAWAAACSLLARSPEGGRHIERDVQAAKRAAETESS